MNVEKQNAFSKYVILLGAAIIIVIVILFTVSAGPIMFLLFLAFAALSLLIVWRALRTSAIRQLRLKERITDFEKSAERIAGDLQKVKKEKSEQLEELNALFDKKIKEKTRELQEARSRMAASIYGLSVGFLMLDNDRNIVLTNPATGKILGFRDEQDQAAGIEKVMGRVAEFEDYLAKILAGENPFKPKEFVFGGKFLKLFPSPIILWGIEESKAQRGETIGTAVLVEDITEAKKLDLAKDEFVAITSHEMRTPLTVIRGNSELLLELLGNQPRNADTVQRIERIHKNSIRMINIVNEFLDLMRLEGKQVEFKKESFDAVAVINEIMADMQEGAAKKKLAVTLEAPPSLPKVIADRGKTRQVLVNVIGNAIHYTEKGWIKIFLKHDGQMVDIFVADTGVGIEPEQQSTLFQKFHTISKQFIHSKEYGSGLGLYISRLIMDKVGGKIWLKESAPGKGSTFVISLPAAQT